MGEKLELLRNGLGKSYLAFLEKPQCVLLNQALISSAYCDEGIEERSIFLAKLYSESGLNLTTSSLDILSDREEEWGSVVRTNLPILQVYLFFDLLHYYKKSDQKESRKFEKFLGSNNRKWFYLSLEALSRLSIGDKNLPVWLCRELHQALDHWGLNRQEWWKALNARSPSLVSELASKVLAEAFQDVQAQSICEACRDWEFSESQKIRLREAVNQKKPPAYLQKMLPECIVSLLPEAGGIQKGSYRTYCQKLHGIVPQLTGCGGHVHLRIIGFLLGLLSDPVLFHFWIELPKKWPSIRLPKAVMAGFLEGLSSMELKGLLSQLSFSSGWFGYILALHRIRLIEDGLFPKEDLIYLFEQGLDEKNEKIVNCTVNAIERSKFSLPWNLCLKGFELAPYLRNRAFCFSRIYQKLTTKDLIPCLFDASFFVQERSFDQIQRSGKAASISQILKEKIKDPFLPLTLKEKLIGHFSG